MLTEKSRRVLRLVLQVRIFPNNPSIHDRPKYANALLISACHEDNDWKDDDRIPFNLYFSVHEQGP